jgi:adenylylsulfate kinase
MQNNKFLKILIMGLPSSGKTTLAADIKLLLDNFYKCHWLNADKVREQFNDWDFNESGRYRQVKRMNHLASLHGQYNDIVICDFVCPLQRFRDEFCADYTVFVNTIEKSSYDDTNNIFEKPSVFDVEVVFKNSKYYSKIICNDLIHKLNNKV